MSILCSHWEGRKREGHHTVGSSLLLLLFFMLTHTHAHGAEQSREKRVLFIIGEGDIIIKKVLVGAAVPPEKKKD